jgi:DNA ligase (NAD+)
MNSNIDEFKIWIQSQSDQYSIELKEKADNAYYNSGNPILSDVQWDWLNTYLINKNSISVCKIGHKVKNNQNKTLLPHKLWSLDKANNNQQFNKWNDKNIHSKYICQDKIDGVSGLFVQTGNQTSLYTRGDGIIGSDISYLIKYLKIPKFDKDITIRGEIIISKDNFIKYTKLYSNSRNMVSGCVNSTVFKEEFNDLEFVCYELFNTQLKPSEQLIFLKNKNCKVVNYAVNDSCTYDYIKDHLIKRKNEGQYIIDGIVVQPDTKYSREINKNPSYAVAVKTLLQSNIASSTVVKVHWSICKWNIIKPKVEIIPKNLNGIIIQFLTAYNAKYVKDNFISKDSHVTFTRAGDVIPKILNVSNSSNTYDMPDIPYKWNETNTDIISTSNDTSLSQMKHIYNFFNMIKVKNMGERTIYKFYQAGYTSINKILKMNTRDISELDGFADKSSMDIFSNIQTRCKEINLHELIAASGTLGKGFSGKKCKDLLCNIPDILTKDRNEEELICIIEKINGFSIKSAKQVASNIKEVKKFISENSDFFNINQSTNVDITRNSELTKIVFSQVRPNDILKQRLYSLNYELCDNINHKTKYLIVKQKQTKTTKILKAEKLNITIYTLEEFVSKHVNDT